MRTIGIDLAAGKGDTAACTIEWRGGAPEVTSLAVGLDDDSLLRLMGGGGRAGIDCPLGWPDPFVEAVVAHRGGLPWPGRAAESAEGFRRALKFRLTDEHVVTQTARMPLSVSADRIGVTAMRCALLLDRLALEGERVDRAGGGQICEVYPAAALRRWSLSPAGYKGKGDEARAARSTLVRGLGAQGDGIVVHSDVAETLVQTDHALDALICALVARAVDLGLTDPPPSEPVIAQRVAREGWIHLPAEGSLGLLLRG